jgi:hypothetical protein
MRGPAIKKKIYHSQYQMPLLHSVPLREKTPSIVEAILDGASDFIIVVFYYYTSTCPHFWGVLFAPFFLIGCLLDGLLGFS